MKSGIPIMSGLLTAALVAAGDHQILRWYDGPVEKKRDPQFDADAIQRAEEKRARRAAKRLKIREGQS